MTEGQNTPIDQDAKAPTGAASFFLRHKTWAVIGAFLIIAVTGGLYLTKSTAFANLNNEQEILSRALTVETTTVNAVHHYQVKQKYSGSIVAGRESDHGFEKPGLLAEVLVDEGSQVKKGDILARLDMRKIVSTQKELEASLAQSVALNNETIARLNKAQATYDRYRVLVDKKHISAQKYDDVKFDLAALKARKISTEAAVIRARAALDSLKVDRQMSTLTARFAGNVIRRYQDEGTALGAGTPVIRLIEDHRLEIHVGLPQSALANISPRERYSFSYQGKKIHTTLRTILKRVDQSTRTVTAIFDIEKNDIPVRAGGLAQLSIDTDIHQSGFWLPNGALAESRRGLWSAYTLTPYKGSKDYSTLSRQELQVLYTDSDRVFVRGTLQNGNQVVSDGIHRLVPGQLVRTREAN